VASARAPDAAQRAAFAAWCAADPGPMCVAGPGSAEQRCTLHRVRDTRLNVAWGVKPLARCPRRKAEFSQPLQSVSACPPPSPKTFFFPPTPNHLRMVAIPSRERGVGHRHERWGGKRWTQRRRRARGSQGRRLACERSARGDERCCCGRRSRVVLAPVAGVKSAEVFRARPGETKPSIRR
jgi:hypothetical protein